MPTVDASVTPGEGTHLAIKISSTFVDIAQCYEFEGPEVMVEAIDTTALTSTIVKSRPSHQPEPDKVSLKVYFDPSDNNTQILFVTDVTTSGTIRDFQITFNDAYTTHAKATFSGFVTSFKLNGAKKASNIGADVEIKMTTAATFTAGS